MVRLATDYDRFKRDGYAVLADRVDTEEVEKCLKKNLPWLRKRISENDRAQFVSNKRKAFAPIFGLRREVGWQIDHPQTWTDERAMDVGHALSPLCVCSACPYQCVQAVRRS
jgi:hypothetical protein